MKTYLFALLLVLMFAVSCGDLLMTTNDQTATQSATEQCPTPTQLVTDLTTASQAQVISLSGVNPLVCPEVSMSHTWDGGKLLFSDSPETVPQRGRLYEDTTLTLTASGLYNRIHAHHVNGFTNGKKMKVAILLKNTGGSTGTLTVQQKGMAGSTMDFLYAGKLVFYRWLTSTVSSPVQVTVGATVRMVIDIEASASTGYLVTGLYDYSFTQNHTVTVCAVYSTDNPLTVCPTLPILPRDLHQRGTFPNNAKVYDTASGIVIDSAEGISQLPLAANTLNDPDVVGIDKTDGSAQTLQGNYGVLYKVHLNLIAVDGRNIGFLMNPRGGTWGGAAWTVPGITPGGKFLVPAGSGYTGDNTKGAVAGKYTPGGGFTFWMQWMPTSASNLPLRFIAVPY